MGGAGNDTLLNSDGDDSLDGGAGDDSMVATGGADTLRGGTGDDYMEGGDDGDTFIIEDGFGDDTIVGGEGTTTGVDDDLIDLSAMTGPVTITYTAEDAGTITDGTDTITFSEVERIIATDQNDSIDGSATWTGLFTDEAGIDVDARGGNDTVFGGRGGDTIEGGTGSDSIEGDYGDDSLSGGAEGDTISGGSGNDTISGGDGNDSIDAGIEDDSIDGGDGNDTIDGGDGADSIDGGDGNDSIGFAVGGDTVDGGAGNDTLLGGFVQGADDAVMRGGDGDDRIVTYGADDTVFGDAGNDTIVADSGDESLSGGADEDEIYGNGGDDTISGGTGDDSLTGGGGDDLFNYNVGDGDDTIADFNFGNSGALGDGDTENNDFINLSGFYDNLAELHEDFDDDGVLNQSNSIPNGGTVDYTNNDEFAASDSLTFQGATTSSFTADNTGVVCFTSGTAIRTPHGDVLIDDLNVGDLVTTMDNGPQRIAWIGRTDFDAAALAAHPNVRPVLIKCGILGNARDLLVSPQHGILLGPDHLARAKHMAQNLPGVRIAHGKRKVSYIHLMLDAHQIIFAEGSPSESFYPGPMALQMMGQAGRASMIREFSALLTVTSREMLIDVYGNTARPFAKKRDVHDLKGFLRAPNTPQFGRVAARLAS